MVMSARQVMVDPSLALPGRDTPIVDPGRHVVLDTPLAPPFPDGFEHAVFAMGCFWGAERLFWQVEGVYTTAVGYSGGYTPNPTYEEVCSTHTGHAESVLVVYDPARVTYGELLRVFFEGHDPTQFMGQGNDIGTQYRSAIFTANEAQATLARATADQFGARVADAGYPPLATEIAPEGPFYYAEAYHQQYLAVNPFGYCGLGGTGVSCPTGLSLTGEPSTEP